MTLLADVQVLDLALNWRRRRIPAERGLTRPVVHARRRIFEEMGKKKLLERPRSGAAEEVQVGHDMHAITGKMPPDLYAEVTLAAATELRVFDLLPGSWDDELTGSLRVIDFPVYDLYYGYFKRYGYDALSYVWGSATENRHIVVNHTEIKITDNLFRALRRLRSKKETQTFWIDALCINQSDDEEKAVQVARMGDVYRAANVVHIWLGERSMARSIHLKAFLRNARLIGDIDRFADSRRRLTALASWSIWAVQRRRDLKESPTEVDPTRRWQNRAWVIQEFVGAKETRICMGAAQIQANVSHQMPRWSSAPDELWTAHFAPRLGLSVDDIVSLSQKLQRFATLVSRWPVRTMKMNKALDVLQNTSASDPRDLVYCIRGLLDPDVAALIKVDYSLSYEQVCAIATYASMAGGGDVGLLPCVNRSRPCDSERLTTSWVADFRYDCLRWDLNGIDISLARPASMGNSYKLLYIPGHAISTVVHTLELQHEACWTALHILYGKMVINYSRNTELTADGVEKIHTFVHEHLNTSTDPVACLRHAIEQVIWLPLTDTKLETAKLSAFTLKNGFYGIASAHLKADDILVKLNGALVIGWHICIVLRPKNLELMLEFVGMAKVFVHIGQKDPRGYERSHDRLSAHRDEEVVKKYSNDPPVQEMELKQFVLC